MSSEIKCTFLKIIYESNNNYCVYSYQYLNKENTHFIAVGYNLPKTPKLTVIFRGDWIDSKYGKQLEVHYFNEEQPKTKSAIISYLVKECNNDISLELATQIVTTFASNTFYIIENTPEKLSEIPEITPQIISNITSVYNKNRMIRELKNFFAPYNIGYKIILNIYETFKEQSGFIVKNHLYKVCRIEGIDFKVIDKIGKRNNIPDNDPYRIQGYLIYLLNQSKGNGHVFMTYEQLKKQFKQNINLPDSDIIQNLYTLITEDYIIYENDNFYLPDLYLSESITAEKICKLINNTNIPQNYDKTLIYTCIAHAEEEFNVSLSEDQKNAIVSSMNEPILIITGRPGTGKTTVVKFIIYVYKLLFTNKDILLLAPTSRASRKIEESTGHESFTIHKASKLLADEETSYDKFHTIEKYNADLIIVDEMSMVDIKLMKEMLLRIKYGAKVILIGDPEQLPSIGPGNVFIDLISCGYIKVSVLNIIYRQQLQSRISYNAECICQNNPHLLWGNDFKFFYANTQKDAAKQIEIIFRKELLSNSIEDVQVLSPLKHNGEAAVNQLNEQLKKVYNPNEVEYKVNNKKFSIGDKVIQVKTTEQVCNGELGFITQIKSESKNKFSIFINYTGVGIVKYDSDNEDISSFELAYATTIHKAQGSEYQIVIIPVLKDFQHMQIRRLLNTSTTRAKKRVYIVGQLESLYACIHNDSNDRNSYLLKRIQNQIK